MTSTRRLRKQHARQEAVTRRWAIDTAKALTLTLYQNADAPVTPYQVGVVLLPGEKPWAEVPARCSLDHSAPPDSTDGAPPERPTGTWLVTNERIVGRYANGDLRGWRWEAAIGCLINLTPGHETVHLDVYTDGEATKIDWSGPAVAPIAVAAVYHLHGAQALLDHPGLAPLRKSSSTMAGVRPPTVTQSAADLAESRPAAARELGPASTHDRSGSGP